MIRLKKKTKLTPEILFRLGWCVRQYDIYVHWSESRKVVEYTELFGRERILDNNWRCLD